MARPLCLETDISGICLVAGLLEVRDGMNYGHDEVADNSIQYPVVFASKNQSSAMLHYSHIEHKGLGFPHGLEKFHHYSFVRELCIITDNKPLMVILSKDLPCCLSSCSILYKEKTKTECPSYTSLVQPIYCRLAVP